MSPEQAPSLRSTERIFPPLRKSLATEAQNGPGLEVIFPQPPVLWHLDTTENLNSNHQACIHAPLSTQPSDSPVLFLSLLQLRKLRHRENIPLSQRGRLAEVAYTSQVLITHHPHSLWLLDSGQASLWSLRLSPLPVVLGLSDKFPRVHSLG